MIEERQTAWKDALTDVFKYAVERDDFEVSFPPIRNNVQAYIDNMNKIARKADGTWTGAVRGKDYVKAGHEALEWKLPPEDEIESMGANLESDVLAPDESTTDQNLNQIALATQEFTETIKHKKETNLTS
jgi:hypothetical protein